MIEIIGISLIVAGISAQMLLGKKPPPNIVERSCVTCAFYEAKQCRRYPLSGPTADKHWCGEYRKNDY